MTNVLIVDDEQAFASATAKVIKRLGFDTAVAGTLAEARKHLGDGDQDIVLLDVNLPDGSGLELIEEIDDERARIVVMTGQPTLDVAIDSLRAQVTDFLVKPVEPERLTTTLRRIERALERFEPVAPAESGHPTFENLVGNSECMLQIYRLIDRVAPSDASVLIQGASGTGKELVAAAIHRRSERAEKPFLSLNCGAVSAELIRSELFGHEKGSFTGSTKQHRGYFERAHGGTFFLDEVTEMPLEQQVQFLRVLETGTMTRVGGDKEIPVDVRIIAATNRDPREAIEAGAFREDLFYRLAVFPIQMPLLAERDDDIVLLAEYFLRRLNKQHGTDKTLSSDAADWLLTRPWPGNVRELRNEMHRAYILAEDTIDRELLASMPVIDKPSSQRGSGLQVQPGTPLADVEKQVILSTLKKFGDDKKRTADVLGVSVKTLYNKLKLYREQDGEDEAS